MVKLIKHLIMIIVTAGFLWYLYIVMMNWEIVAENGIWVGVVDILIPFSINVFIYLFLYQKLHLINYDRIKKMDKEIKNNKKSIEDIKKEKDNFEEDKK